MKLIRILLLLMIPIAMIPVAAFAQEHIPVEARSGFRRFSPPACGDMEVWDNASGMCQGLNRGGMEMSMLMVHGNAFGAQIFEEGTYGRNEFAAPNMLMADLGTSLGQNHYVNFEIMSTLEKWTFPLEGYPELLQIGEHQANGEPFVDAQHPHSSPIMGLTFSDTIAFGSGSNHFKFWFSPRGQSTDGPIAFMHRPTGMVNPDTPLGHHVGQDVGHITSTVIGTETRIGDTQLELSAFHGKEPQPTKVDLPIGEPDSLGARLTQYWTPSFYTMASAAYVQHPETHDDGPSALWRYSLSGYNDVDLGSGWSYQNALVLGLITKYDHASSLASVLDEGLLVKGNSSIWGRIEVLQRTAEQLEITGVDNEHAGRWVSALTLGYSHQVAQYRDVALRVGASVTKDFLPQDFTDAYGEDPLSGKVFLQIGGMSMFMF